MPTKLVAWVAIVLSQICVIIASGANDGRNNDLSSLQDLLLSGSPMELPCGYRTCDRRTQHCLVLNPSNPATYHCKPCDILCGPGRITNDQYMQMCLNNCTIYMLLQDLKKTHRNGVEFGCEKQRVTEVSDHPIIDDSSGIELNGSVSSQQPSVVNCNCWNSMIYALLSVIIACLVFLMTFMVCIHRNSGHYNSNPSLKSSGGFSCMPCVKRQSTASGVNPESIGPGATPQDIGPGVNPQSIGPGATPQGIGPGVNPQSIGPGVNPQSIRPGTEPKAGASVKPRSASLSPDRVTNQAEPRITSTYGSSGTVGIQNVRNGVIYRRHDTARHNHGYHGLTTDNSGKVATDPLLNNSAATVSASNSTGHFSVACSSPLLAADQQYPGGSTVPRTRANPETKHKLTIKSSNLNESAHSSVSERYALESDGSPNGEADIPTAAPQLPHEGASQSQMCGQHNLTLPVQAQQPQRESDLSAARGPLEPPPISASYASTPTARQPASSAHYGSPPAGECDHYDGDGGTAFAGNRPSYVTPRNTDGRNHQQHDHDDGTQQQTHTKHV